MSENETEKPVLEPDENDSVIDQQPFGERAQGFQAEKPEGWDEEHGVVPTPDEE